MFRIRRSFARTIAPCQRLIFLAALCAPAWVWAQESSGVVVPSETPGGVIRPRPGETMGTVQALRLFREARDAWAYGEVSDALTKVLDFLEIQGSELANERVEAISLFNRIDKRGMALILDAGQLEQDGRLDDAQDLLSLVAKAYVGTESAIRAKVALQELLMRPGIGHGHLLRQVERDAAAGDYYWILEWLSTVRSVYDPESAEERFVNTTFLEMVSERGDAIRRQAQMTVLKEARGLFHRENYEESYRRFEYLIATNQDEAELKSLERWKVRIIDILAKRGARREFVMSNSQIFRGIVLWRRNGTVALKVETGIIFLDELNVLEEKNFGSD